MKLLPLLLAALPMAAVAQQSPTERFARFLTTPQHYVCQRSVGILTIDGKLDEPAWQRATPITHFEDISGEGFAKPRYNTTAKMLWDDNYLYIGAVLQDPHVWADLTKRDEVVYYNNDFEVFIDPDGDGQNYFEIEINPLNTVFDLSLTHAYRAPRGSFVQFQWNCPGLLTATSVQGTLNNATDTDEGWTLEMAIPRTALASEFDKVLEAGRTLRLGFSRVEWQYEVDANGKYSRKRDAAGKYLPEDNWTWGATGQVAMHMPERWGYVQLSPTQCGTPAESYKAPADAAERRLLWAMFYAQEEQMNQHKRYIKNLKDFHLTKDDLATLPAGARLEIETTSRTYEMSVVYADGSRLVIDEAGTLYRVAP